MQQPNNRINCTRTQILHKHHSVPCLTLPGPSSRGATLFLATSAKAKGTFVKSVSAMAAQIHRPFLNSPLLLKTIIQFLITKTSMTFSTPFRKQVVS
jgi:hypothetical protein